MALKNDEDEWEPYDQSTTAQEVFPFNQSNLEKHHVPPHTLRLLAKSWNRIYAWHLADPVKLEPELPLHIKKGAQKIQTMDAETWAAEWSKFQQRAELPQPSTSKTSETMIVLGMGLKDAFALLEGSTTFLLKSYKPQIDSMANKNDLVHVAVSRKGTTFIVGSIHLQEVRPLKSIADLRKLESEGHRYLRSSGGKQSHKLESGENKLMYAWLIDQKELLQPPLTWKSDPLIF